MKIYYNTFGCKVNQYETELLRENISLWGDETVRDIEACDIALVNTCSVTGAAEKKCRNLIRKIRKKNSDCKIILTGCYSQRDKESLGKEMPGLIITGNELKYDLKNHWEKISSRSIDAEQVSGIASFAGHTRAFIKIQDGCDSFCSYCIVPYVRPSLISRPSADVIQEIEGLLSAGYKEIVLSGIRLGRYSADGYANGRALAGLLKDIINLSGDFRMRLSSLEAVDITDELTELIAGSDKICRHLHLPLQSGSDKILKRMNRPYDTRRFKDIIKKLYARMPDIAVSTDVIVGFPGEEKKDFEETYSLIKELVFSRLHVFTYSPRPGTKAEKFTDKVDHAFINASARRMKELGRDCERSFVERQLGKKQRVLPESRNGGLTDGYIKIALKNQTCKDFIYGKIGVKSQLV